MRAALFEAFGDPSVLTLKDIDTPVPGAGELLIRQSSSSINFVDLMIRRGGYPRLGSEILPYVGGRDAAGTVAAVGEGVDQSWLGEVVYGLPEMDRGCFADYVILQLSELSKAPKTVPMDDLGSVPLAALTAWQGLHAQGEIKAGERVLVQGGSGGVGHFAVQMAKAAGAEVFATGASRNVEFLKYLGADHVIAYDTERFEDVVTDIDLLFDTVGGETLERSFAVVKPGARIISAVAVPDEAAVAKAGLSKGLFFISESSGADLATIAELFDQGVLNVAIGARFDLSEMAEAQTTLAERSVRGKTGITIS